MKNIRQLLGSSAFSDLDRHFAAFVEVQAGGDRPSLALAAALVSRRRSEGDICLNLEAVAGSVFPDRPMDAVEPVRIPGLKAWVGELKGSAVVGAPGEFKPLILDARHRLYLHRYWHYEQTLAAAIRRRTAHKPDPAPSGERFQALFPSAPGGCINWQGVAALAAARGRFCVISGGPGTGKTHTLVLILAWLLERQGKLRIAVAAPTGKAAARIQDTIQRVKATLPCDEAVKSLLPERASTIHRLLGYIPDSARFRHQTDNLLPYDVVGVDEASMVDLALMAKLLEAIPPGARVILLGDKDQLASVEAGAVLGDICSAAPGEGFSAAFRRQAEELMGCKLPAGAGRKKPGALADCIVQLQRNYRFGEQSAIYRLSNAINEGRAPDALGILRECSGKAAAELVAAALPRRAELKEALRARVTAGFAEFLGAADPAGALAALTRFRILCALREGPFGVAGLNQLTEEILAEAGLIRPSGQWYSRRPILIRRNDYHLKLFNGDMGVILPAGEGGEPRAFFPGPDNTVRQFLPLRLPEHETAYALTVHKSQGSEFDRVLLLLPDRKSAVLTRELLYTGITRARRSVELWFEEEIFSGAVARRVNRGSGLCDALAGA